MTASVRNVLLDGGVGAILLVLFAVPGGAVHAQVDSTTVVSDTTVSDTTVSDTTAAPADTTVASVDTVDTTVAPDDTTAVSPDTTDSEAAELPDDPRTFTTPVYGRPAIDSLPTLTPHVGLEHALAQQTGSFLYDLAAVGWPHGWSPNGLGPHRSRLWIDGRPYNSPLTGRARFDLVPTSFLQRPGIGEDPGGGTAGVQLSWRSFPSIRPITELRFRRDSNGQKAIEVVHSQKHQLSFFGEPGLFQTTFGYGGRTADGVYSGSDLRRERRIWGRLRYQRDNWAFELSDFSSRHRIGAHGGVVPPEGSSFETIYIVPRCEACSHTPGASRRTFRNDLTARVRGPVFPGLSTPAELSATWTSNTFDFQESGSDSDTTWTVAMDGAHGSMRQSLRLGPHDLTLGVRGSLWGVGKSNVRQVDGERWAVHAIARDSVRLGATQFVLDAGWHSTIDQQYPSASAQLYQSVGPVQVTASAAATGQRLSWIETAGFEGLVTPLDESPTSVFGRVLRGNVGLEVQPGPFDLRVEGFAHQIRKAVDLYALPSFGQRVASADTVEARQTETPVRRVGATASVGWRRDATWGFYATAQATALSTLNAAASRLHTRLARTLPRFYGRGRIGARFVFFEDLVTDLYVQARGWTAMNSRWFHPPTGRFAVPPAENPVPVRPGYRLGPNGTVDAHAEIKLRGATLFFTFENIQLSLAQPGSFQRQFTAQPGAFIVPVYPLPGRLFRFGVHWPIFD
ncbi:hypothetical protein BSZ35_12665 [Salinibacter sp. 10B]|uniref:putative porin n=1 Tax=Salinibacter sp. 10B TaxID=1923971 RepID=UPI000CF377A1|nr:putative porin [Salinibacter sp. 10B]PQJ35340.1 hypothetical protein BSZ35_12665 [Salinibacter sp. 10B]